MSTVQEIKSLKKEIADVKTMLADHAEEAADESKGIAMITRAELQEMASKAGQSVREFATNKREQIDMAAKTTQKTIKARPLTSAAVAMAGGMVLGALLRRK